VIATLATDLLIGIVAGTVLKLVISAWTCRSANVFGFFGNPVRSAQLVGSEYHIHVTRPLVCFSVMKFSSELDKVPSEAKSVVVHLDEAVALIDHSTNDQLQSFITDSTRSGIPVNVVGLDLLHPVSSHPSSARVRPRNGSTQQPA